eukprot:3372211-Prymnesium_polylepis.2
MAKLDKLLLGNNQIDDNPSLAQLKGVIHSQGQSREHDPCERSMQGTGNYLHVMFASGVV